MIPIETRNGREISIGVSVHLDKFDVQSLNTLEKFIGFLKTNHRVLYNLVTSGEIIDFHKLPKEASTSRQFISSDNWYLVGDAAAVFDPFYSTGMVMLSFEVCSNTEVIRLTLEKDPAMPKRAKLFDEFVKAVTSGVNHLMSRHSHHLGHASAMSWRIYFESTITFGMLEPFFLGGYHTCPVAVSRVLYLLNGMFGLRNHFYDILDYIVDHDVNCGFMDNSQGGYLLGEWCPTSTVDYDHALTSAKYEHKRLNHPEHVMYTSFYLILEILLITWRAYGLMGILRPSTIYYCLFLFRNMVATAILSLIHKIKYCRTPYNTILEKKNIRFKNYKYVNKAQPWVAEPMKMDKME